MLFWLKFWMNLPSPTCTLHVLPPLHFLIYHPNNIWWGVQLLTGQLSSASCCILPHRSIYFELCSQTPLSLCFSLNARDQVSHSQNNRQNYICVYFNFYDFKQIKDSDLNSINSTLIFLWNEILICYWYSQISEFVTLSKDLSAMVCPAFWWPDTKNRTI
jgi:hypothetical protein